ncbi:MAG: sigma-70 family RNA polymerase sigma factor [Sedimentisphaerales bacterium]|nr:sigma-70 family RNA polymerase sigma factor [Sedimentisphaerales bacterium]
MLEDRVLVWRFNRGSKESLRRIYEKYKDDLLGLAVSLLRDRSTAEDVVHDVIVGFAQNVGTFRLSGSLKGYLATCVANNARDRNRLKSGRDVGLAAIEEIEGGPDRPAQDAIQQEQSQRLEELLAKLPYEQREVIVLHLHYGMRFRQIARSTGVSTNTIQSRYRYGLDKLRSLLDGEVEK